MFSEKSHIFKINSEKSIKSEVCRKKPSRASKFIIVLRQPLLSRWPLTSIWRHLHFLLAEQTEGQTAWMGEQSRLVWSQWLRRSGRWCILRDGSLRGGGGCWSEWHQTAAGPPAAAHTQRLTAFSRVLTHSWMHKHTLNTGGVGGKEVSLFYSHLTSQSATW